MISQNETDDAINAAVLDNRKQRGRFQAELVLIQSLSLALDEEVNFEFPPKAEDKNSNVTRLCTRG
jgi:hypothetical protein